jgi:hypothetical protein
MQIIPAHPTQSYHAAMANAERRARHSPFDQHVISDNELGYIAIDEGDYPALPDHLIERIVYTVTGALFDQ